jgi:hypothetical protein
MSEKFSSAYDCASSRVSMIQKKGFSPLCSYFKVAPASGRDNDHEPHAGHGPPELLINLNGIGKLANRCNLVGYAWAGRW